MPQKPPDLGRIVQALVREEADFVVIGGLAMVLHGSSYVTLDCDLAIASTPVNASAIVRALAPLRPVPSHLPEDFPIVWDERSIAGLVVSLRTDAGDLDLFLFVPGLDSYEGLASRAVTREIAGVHVRVGSLEDLIAMKKEANRPKDLAHLAELELLREIEDES